MLASKLNERHEWVLISLLSLAVYNQRRVPFVSSGNEEAVLWRVRDKCWILGMLVWRCMHRWHGLLREDPFEHQTERCSCRLDWFHHHSLCLHMAPWPLFLCWKWCHHSLPIPRKRHKFMDEEEVLCGNLGECSASWEGFCPMQLPPSPSQNRQHGSCWRHL